MNLLLGPTTVLLKLPPRKLSEYRQRLHDLFKDDRATDLLGESNMPNDDKVFLTRFVQIIKEKLDDPELNAVFIEKTFSISKMQLYRKLTAITGMTPGEFIKNIRLKYAAQLLISTRLTVSEIFYRTGFNNQSYFFREFKKRYACPPNEYKRTKLSMVCHSLS